MNSKHKWHGLEQILHISGAAQTSEGCLSALKPLDVFNRRGFGLLNNFARRLGKAAQVDRIFYFRKQFNLCVNEFGISIYKRLKHRKTIETIEIQKLKNNRNFALFRNLLTLLFRTLQAVTSAKISAKTDAFSRRYDQNIIL